MKSLRKTQSAIGMSIASVAAIALTSCGSPGSDPASEAPAKAPTKAPGETVNASLAKLSSSGDVMGFAINALSSSMKGTAATSLALDGQGDGAHAKFPQCTWNGEAYSQSQARRMEPSDPTFSEATLFCQLNITESAETIVGSLSMAKKVLCTVERSLGKAPEYTAAGKTYSGVKLKMSEDCGWTAEEVAEMSSQMPPATFVTKQLASGDWQRSVSINVGDMIDFQMFYTVDGDMLAVKKVEGWKQTERCARSESSCNANVIPEAAIGKRGDVIAIDLKSGTLHAETTDNYWGRRARGIIKGKIGANGAFSSVSAIELIYADVSAVLNQGAVGVYGKVASAKGTSDAGILFKGGAISCGGSNGCGVDAFATAGSVSGPDAVCSKTGGCAGNSGFSFSFSNVKVLDFLRLGASFDAKDGSRAKNETWLESAGIPDFSSVDFSATVD